MSLKQDATFLLRWCGGDAIERIVNIMRMTVVVAIIMFNIVAQAAEPFPPLSAVPGPEVNREKVEAEYLARAKQGAEEHRKAEATFTFVDEQGKPLTRRDLYDISCKNTTAAAAGKQLVADAYGW